MKTVAILFTLMFFTNVHATSKQCNQVDSIKVYMSNCKWDHALELIQKSLHKFGSTSDLYRLKGTVLRNMYSFKPALDAFYLGLAMDSTNNLFNIEIANTYKLMLDYQNAMTFYTKAFHLDTLNISLQIEKANCEYLNDLFPLAIVDFNKLYHKDTSNYFIIKRLAQCYNKTGQTDTALYFYKQASLQSQPDENILVQICNLLITSKKFTEGISLSNTYIKTFPMNAKVNYQNAYLYLLNKQYDTAVVKFRTCMDLNDTSRLVLKNLGIAYFKMDSFASAKTYLEKAYWKDTTDLNGLEFLGIACYQSYYKKLGIEYLEKALQLYQPMEDEYNVIYKNLSNACNSWALCPHEKTLGISLRAFELNPNDTVLCYIIAEQYQSLKKYQEALHYYVIYLKSISKNTDPHLDNARIVVTAQIQQLRKYLKESK